MMMMIAPTTAGFALAPTARLAAPAPLRRATVHMFSLDDAIASTVPSIARVSVPPSSSSSFSASTHEAAGSAIAIEVHGEAFLLTAAHVVGDTDILDISLPADNFATRHQATVVGRVESVDLCLLSLPEHVTPPPAISIGTSVHFGESDFAIALSAVDGNRALGLVKSKTSVGPTLAVADEGVTSGPSSYAPVPRQAAPPCTAEAAMAEAEAEAEERANARGDEPFLVVDAPSVEGVVGGPLLSADGELLGLTTLVMSAGAESTRYFAVSNERISRAVDAILDRRALGEQVRGARVVLQNDPSNTIESVQTLLRAAGLSEQAAQFATMSAHRTGRGVIGHFETADDAKAFCKRLAFAELELSEEQLPSALVVTAETFDFYKDSTAGYNEASDWYKETFKP